MFTDEMELRLSVATMKPIKTDEFSHCTHLCTSEVNSNGSCVDI